MSAVFLFPGQGSQYVGMGIDYLKRFPEVARRFDQAGELLGLDLLRIVSKGPKATLVQTNHAQVAIYTLSVSITEQLAERGVLPAVTAGHSLGQFSALVAAGAMSFEDGLALVVQRSQLMHEQNQQLDGGMIAVAGLPLESIRSLIDGLPEVWTANLNADGQIILSGQRAALGEAVQCLAGAGGKAVWLDVAGPYHCPLMDSAAQAFSACIDQARITDARIPLIANTSAEPLTAAADLRSELHRHMLAPVRWSESMQRIAALDLPLLLEVGPGKVLKGLALRNGCSIRCLTTDTLREMEMACSSYHGAGACASS